MPKRAFSSLSIRSQTLPKQAILKYSIFTLIFQVINLYFIQSKFWFRVFTL